MARHSVVKDPSDVLDFSIDYTSDNWLESGETISTSTWALTNLGFVDDSDDITIDSDSESTTVSTVWLSGGDDGENYKVTNTITTSASRTKISSILVQVRTN